MGWGHVNCNYRHSNNNIDSVNVYVIGTACKHSHNRNVLVNDIDSNIHVGLNRFDSYRYHNKNVTRVCLVRLGM